MMRGLSTWVFRLLLAVGLLAESEAAEVTGQCQRARLLTSDGGGVDQLDDVDADGDVDVEDLEALLGHYREVCRQRAAQGWGFSVQPGPDGPDGKIV